MYVKIVGTKVMIIFCKDSGSQGQRSLAFKRTEIANFLKICKFFAKNCLRDLDPILYIASFDQQCLRLILRADGS